MNQLILTLLILLSSFAAFGQSLNIYSIGNGQMKVVGVGFVGSANTYQVNLKRDGKRIQTLGTRNGSFEYISPRAFFKNGETLVVSVINYNGNRKHFTRNGTYRDSTGGGSDPAPGPVPRPRLPDYKIRKYADIQARTVANRVKDTYGEQEKFKHNLTNGFWEGYSLQRRHENRYDSGYGEYQRGLKAGIRIGARDGETKGYNDASSQAVQNVSGLVHQRFAKAIDGGVVDKKVGAITTPHYSGARPPYSESISIEDKLQEMQDDFSRSIRSYYYKWDDWRLTNVYKYNGDYKFVKDYFRSDYAWQEWHNNKLDGRYSYTLYREMNDEEKETYKNYFKSIYDNVIDYKFFDKLKEYHSRAHSIGIDYGYRAGKEMAYQEGILAGKMSEYSIQSVSSFHSNYQSLYKKAFNQKVSFYENNPVVKEAVLRISGNYLPGGSISLEVIKLVNYGEVAADISLTIDSSDAFNVSQEMRLKLEGLSSLKDGVEFKDMATITSSVTPDVSHPVGVRIKHYGQYNSLNFKVNWQSIIESFGELSFGSPMYKKTKTYIISKLEEEWQLLTDSKPSKKKIWYSNGKPNGQKSLLEKIIREYETASTGRQNYEDLADSDLCAMASGHKWIISRSKFYSGKAFKELFQKIQPSCD